MDVVINSDLLAIMLLYSLPSSFENFRCAIESRDELPALEVLKVKIIEESEARKNEIRERPSKMHWQLVRKIITGIEKIRLSK